MKPSSTIFPNLLTFGFIASGALLCGAVGKSLVADPELKAPLNPFGINTSPYGEVLAMAMQGPIDVYWHNASRENRAEVSTEALAPDSPLRDCFRVYLDELGKASVKRTNLAPSSEAQKRHFRRKVEDKLRFAYHLDPSHYANYNSYHFFLTEPALGTRPELTPGAVKLADQTIRYCLSRVDDPRPSLTAAAAAENLLELMFNDQANPRPRFTTEHMRIYLGVLDDSIARYQAISDHWDRTGNWSLLSEQRLAECKDRFQFVMKMRDTAEKTIQRFESDSSGSSAANPLLPK